MNANLSLHETRPMTVLQDLVDRHGRLSVLAFALAALLRPRRPVANLFETDLSDHLLRDIGISARGGPVKGWEHYR